MKKKIILIHPPTPYLVIPKWSIPITLLFLRSYFISKNFDADILDLANEGEDYLLKIPLDADAYGITLYTPQEQLAKDISFYLRERTNALLVAGGHHVTFMDMKFLEESAYDVIIRGEGEISFEEVLQGEKLSSIKGITYRDGNQIIRNLDRPFNNDLDIYPFPRLDALNLKEYPGSYIKQSHSEYRIRVIFSRGCVGKCTFCTSVNFWKRKVRFHSYEWIKENVEYLLNNYGVRDLDISDDNFLIHKDFEKLCLLFNRHNIRWSCQGISRHITDEKSKLMKETGCSSVALGIESGSEKILNSLDKSSKLEHHIKAISILRKHKISVKGLFMVGLPKTRQEDIDLTVNFIRENPMDNYGLTTFVPFPGTPIWNDPEEHGCDLDKSIPFSEYLILSKTTDTATITGDQNVINKQRKQILEAMGDKCTNYAAIKRGKKYA